MTTEHLDWMTGEDELNLSVEQIGEALYAIAAWIEKEGNRGYGRHYLAAAHLPTTVLETKYKQAWQEIVFEGEGRRRDDFNGWGVHKKTPRHWTRTWVDRYGINSPIGQRLYAEAWQAALIEDESRRVRRAVDNVAGLALEEMKTIDVAYYAALCDVLARRARRRYYASGLSQKAQLLLARVMGDHAGAFRDELVYRTKTQPQKRRSKKATLAAWVDWEQAPDLLDRGVEAFFTEAYIAQCVRQAKEPDLSVDYENLPKGTIKQTPIMHLQARDLVAEFMKLLSAEDEFDREDAQTILRALRPMLARIKGQGATVAVVLPTDEAEV